MEQSLTCGFTGHREIKKDHASDIFDLVMRGVGYAYDRGYRTFVTGGAIGFDTVCAKAVIFFRMSHPDVRLELVLPCKNQADHWGASDREVYEYLLRSADSLEYVSEAYTESCMRRRNMRIVERSDMIIAYVSHSKSGSGQTLRLASEKNRIIYNLYPKLEEKNTKKM